MSFHQFSTLKRHRKTDIFHEMPFEKSLFLQVTPLAMMTTQKALSRKEFCSYLFTSFLAVFRMGRRTGFGTFHRDRTSMKWRATWSRFNRRLVNLRYGLRGPKFMAK